MCVKDAVAVLDEDNEFVAIVLLQLTAPALGALTIEQMMRKGRINAISTWLLVGREQRGRGEMVRQSRQGARIGQDFTGGAIDQAMRDGLGYGLGCRRGVDLGFVPQPIGGGGCQQHDHEGQMEELRAYLLEMHRAALPVAQLVATATDLSTAKQLLDIGSGLGTYALAFCRRFPELHATLLDLPKVIAIADTLLPRDELGARIRTLTADYHQDPLPSGHDIALMCNVLHQEDEAKVRHLLRKAHRTLRRRGVLVVVDAVLDDDKCGPLSVALGALNQLIHQTGATYYSAAELTGWLRGAGFAKVERKPFPLPNQALLFATKL